MPAAPSSLIKRLAGNGPDLVVPALVGGGLLEALASVPDPRSRHGRRFPLPALLALAVCAVTCDANGFTAIHQWATDLPEQVLARFGLPRCRYTGFMKLPGDKTIRVALARIDPAALIEAVGRYGAHRLEQAGMAKIPVQVAAEREARRRAKAGAREAERRAGRRGRRRIRALAADGKTLRGSGRTRSERTHLVAVVEHHTRTVFSRVAVPGKTNETPGLRAHLEELELHGAVLTADAAHTCRESAAKILERGGHYLLVVKANTPTLHAALIARLTTGDKRGWARRSHTETTRGHGRIEQRYLRAADAADIDFPGAAQVMMLITRRRPINPEAGRGSKEITFAITSLPKEHAGPADLAAIKKGHWSCETRHHVLDATFREDHCQARAEHAAENLSTLRDLAIEAIRHAGHANTAHARRHYTHRPERVLGLYGL